MGVVDCLFVLVVEDDWRLPLPTTLVHASRPPRRSFGLGLGPKAPVKSYWVRALNSPDTALASRVWGLSRMDSES